MYAQNISFDADRLPAYTPETSYTTVITYFIVKQTAKVEIVKVKTSGRIANKVGQRRRQP